MPPPVSAEGEPVVVLPEKTFLEKYWMYAVGLVMLTRQYTFSSCLCPHLTLLLPVLMGGGEEEKPRN